MMVSSPVATIRNLYIRRLPTGRVTKAAKAIRVDNICLIVGEDGRLYHEGRMRDYAYCVGEYPWTNSLMKALLRLGYITADELEQHMEAARRHDKLTQERSDKKVMKKLVERNGIKLTVAQKKWLADVGGDASGEG